MKNRFKTLEEMFPRTVFVKRYVKQYGLDKAITEQLTEISSELLEIRDAFTRKDYESSIEESIDAIQSIYTLLYMIPEYSLEKVEKIIEQVQKKNKRRNYLE